MRAGIFDHLDATGAPLQAFYRDRFAYVEAADRAGIDSYHIAEHHTTPLGMAPSPGVYLAAVAQRTSRLRFGPLVYILPQYHPLRLIEEICMLDQMSGGRLELGLGRGISPFEARNYGVDPDRTRAIYEEYSRAVLEGLQTREFNFEGEYYSARRLPMQMDTLQKPYPPLWFGIGNTGNAERAGRLGASCVSLHDADMTRTYVEAWRAALPANAAPNLRFGQCFFMVIDTDGPRALDLARQSYLKWRESFHFLYYHNDTSPVQVERAQTFDQVMAEGRGVAGTPAEVRDYLAASLARSGVNYVLGQFYFGAMPASAAVRSVDLFARDILPALQHATAPATG